MSYKFLDSGNFRKLEQFGDFIVDRPAPFAEWKRSLSLEVWEGAHAAFVKSDNGGEWTKMRDIPDAWQIKVDEITFNLKLSGGGQTGIFPEQVSNWRWLKEICSEKPLKILNGFAYTGGSTLFAALNNGDGELTHVDGAKSAVLWAKENALSSNLSERKIRWITDDVLKFMEREVRRGTTYDGIILDPPAFGRGPDGKIWKLSKDIGRLFELIGELLNEDSRFLLFSCHDSEIDKDSLLRYSKELPRYIQKSAEVVDLTIKSESGQKVNMGKTLRLF